MSQEVDRPNRRRRNVREKVEAPFQRGWAWARRRLELFGTLWKEAIALFWSENGSRRAAALAFYMIFSLPALLVILLSVGGMIVSPQAVESALTARLSSVLEPEVVGELAVIASQAWEPTFEKALVGVIGLLVLLLNALWAFLEMQMSFNELWGVHGVLAAESTFRDWFRYAAHHLRSVFVTIATALVLLVFLASRIAAVIDQTPPGGVWGSVTDTLLSMLAVVILLMVVYRYVPEVSVNWSTALTGAFVTALLFAPAKVFIGMLLGQTALRSTYGAAGSLVVLLIWIYYLASIFYIGVAFTKVWRDHRLKGEPLIQ